MLRRVKYLNSFMIQQNQQLKPSSLVDYLKDILTGQVSEGKEAICVKNCNYEWTFPEFNMSDP